jgi:hypothetical protein
MLVTDSPTSWRSHPSRQEIPPCLWYPQISCCVHKSPPLDPALTRINSVHALTFYFSEIHLNILPFMFISRVVFPLMFHILERRANDFLMCRTINRVWLMNTRKYLLASGFFPGNEILNLQLFLRCDQYFH